MNKKLVWYLVMVLSIQLLICSCKEINEKVDKSTSKKNNAETKIDSTQWLKETRGVRDILEDKQGNLWFSSPDYIAKFNGKSMYYFSESDGLDITGNIHKDDNDTIWIENGFRAFRFDGKTFSEERIDSIKGSNGLWFQRGLNPTDTTYVRPGLYEINQENINFHALPVKEDVNNKYLYYPTTKAVLGKDSTIWVGTMERVYGFKNNSFISIGRKEMGRQDDERQMGIRGIFMDSKGILWIADNGAGVFSYNGREVINFTKKHHLDEGDAEGSTLDKAFSIAEGSDGTMWFGTVYSGVWSHNPTTKEFRNYTSDDGIKSENIWTIYQTKEGELLFAGESPAAVYIFNGKTFDRKY